MCVTWCWPGGDPVGCDSGACGQVHLGRGAPSESRLMVVQRWSTSRLIMSPTSWITVTMTMIPMMVAIMTSVWKRL